MDVFASCVGPCRLSLVPPLGLEQRFVAGERGGHTVEGRQGSGFKLFRDYKKVWLSLLPIT